VSGHPEPAPLAGPLFVRTGTVWIERVAQRIGRWQRRPRFRTPGSGIVLAVAVLAALLVLARTSEAPRARPPRLAPSPSPAAPPAQILTAEPPAQIPGETAATGCPEGCAVPPPGCDIKGNISGKTGERIYHLPGQGFYDRTVISPERGEAWFCTEAEARANGWRKSKR
jgi:murein DD-endopeptidase MepM/ murein hydrolase activator NlpD